MERVAIAAGSLALVAAANAVALASPRVDLARAALELRKPQPPWHRGRVQAHGFTLRLDRGVARPEQVQRASPTGVAAASPVSSIARS